MHALTSRSRALAPAPAHPLVRRSAEIAAAAASFRRLVMANQCTRRGRERASNLCVLSMRCGNLISALRPRYLPKNDPKNDPKVPARLALFHEERPSRGESTRALFELPRARRCSFSYRRFRRITSSERRLGLRFFEVPVPSGRGSRALFGVICRYLALLGHRRYLHLPPTPK